MKQIACIALYVVLQGCATAGSYFTIDQANQVRNGMTREEVIEVMQGKPYSIRDQGKTFVWSYAESGLFGQTQHRAVRFSFDADGKVYGIPEGGAYGDIKKYQ